LRQDLGLIDWILIVSALTPLMILGALAFRRAAIRLPGGTVENREQNEEMSRGKRVNV